MKTLTLLLAVAAPVLLGGCANYLDHNDTVTFGAGDAVAWNKAAQIQDPWNRDSYATSISTDGEVVAAAQRRRLLLLPPGTATPPPATTP